MLICDFPGLRRCFRLSDKAIAVGIDQEKSAVVYQQNVTNVFRLTKFLKGLGNIRAASILDEDVTGDLHIGRTASALFRVENGKLALVYQGLEQVVHVGTIGMGR